NGRCCHPACARKYNC
uniref:Alpha-conotoxin-like MIB n=1 Tax=Conus magus TaxID=6492 RepID=CA1B_CONMA|nr:RecName: Full=Alpha-conotoxin-like MIB [Conus magus]